MTTSIFRYLQLITFLAMVGCSNSSDNELMAFSDGSDWGYVNTKGEIVINPQFGEAYNFSDGLALVSNSEGRWGYIDQKGNFLGPAPSYSSASYFSEGKAWVVSPLGAPTCIDKNGSVQFTCEKCASVSVFKEGLALFTQRNDAGEVLCGYLNSGFINSSGELKINYQFKAVSPRGFNENDMAAVYDGKKWGWIDLDGKFICNPQFEGSADHFADDFWLISNGDNFGFSSNNGSYLVNPQFDEISSDGTNDEIELIPFGDGKSWGYINMDGKIVINPQFEMAYQFNNGLAVVKSSNGYGLIDEEGKYKVNPQFVSLRSLALTGNKGFSTVNSQYVDVGNLSSELKLIFELIDGTGKIENILTMLECDEDDFVNSYYPQYQSLFVGTRPVSDAGLVLSDCRIWNGDLRETKVVKDTDGWYNYTSEKNVLLKGKAPSLWQFIIYSNGNLSGLMKDVFEVAFLDELKRRLPNYEFSEMVNSQDENYVDYTFKGSENSIIITVGSEGALFRKFSDAYSDVTEESSAEAYAE